MGKKGKKAQAGKPKKLTPKDVGKRLNALAKNLEEELEGADLFAPLPPIEDCAICLVPLSRDGFFGVFQACCGNDICKACFLDNRESIKKQRNAGKKVAFTCPFCREPEPTSKEERMRRLQARCLQKDSVALALMGDLYRRGLGELDKDDLKALDCWIRAVELGSPAARSGGDLVLDSLVVDLRLFVMLEPLVGFLACSLLNKSASLGAGLFLGFLFLQGTVLFLFLIFFEICFFGKSGRKCCCR